MAVRRFLDAKDMVFCFGSNLQGIHGKGAALHAKTRLEAQTGVANGPTGLCYAIPTRQKKGDDFQSLPLFEIKARVNDFLAYANLYNRQVYQVTRIGCGLGGYSDREMAALFETIPPNVLLPGLWRQLKNPSLSILAVVGSRSFNDFDRFKSVLDSKLEQLRQANKTVILCSGGAKEGADAMIERYEKEVDPSLKLTVFDANWRRFNRAAGVLRNRTIAWYSTDVLSFYDGRSPGSTDMLTVAKQEGLNVEVISTAG